MREKQLQNIEREMREKNHCNVHIRENIFQIVTPDSFIIGSD